MIDPMAKVQLVTPRSEREAVLRWLQEQEVLHIIETEGERAELDSTGDLNYTLAQIQFALEFMKRVRKELSIKEKKDLKNMFAGKPAATLEALQTTLEKLGVEKHLAHVREWDEKLAELSNRERVLQDRVELLKPWKNLKMLPGLEESQEIKHYLIKTSIVDGERLQEATAGVETAMLQRVHQDLSGKRQGWSYWEGVVTKEAEEAANQVLKDVNAELVELGLEEGQMPGTALDAAKHELKEVRREYKETLDGAQELFVIEKELKFAYDALLHQQERDNLNDKLVAQPFTVTMTAWLPKRLMAKLEKALDKEFSGVWLTEIEKEEGEEPPVTFKNSQTIRPFEAVTDIFGKPKYTELDPSPFLAVFFLAGFGLALTDAGYGLVMMAGMYAAQKFFRLKREMRKMVRLLFYAGAATVIAGALTGGWFGITLEELPPSAVRDALLKLKLVDPIQEPMTLLAVAFAIGVIQLLFAWVVRAYDHWRQGMRKEAIIDDMAWVTLVLSIFGWIAAGQGLLPTSTQQPFLWLIYAHVGLMILTQGRQHKNIFLRLGSGALSLYGLVNFLSDMLSYSRLLALGLATGIIGLVVNLLGGMVSGIPAVGWLLALIVLLGGHAFNLGINTLGAFIHSGRLQFVEFFPKFLEGGGVAYKPFGRVSRFVDNPNEFIS